MLVPRRRRAADRRSCPRYTALDLRIGWRSPRRLELFVSGHDLLDASHPEFGPATPRRVEIERAVRVGLTVRY